MSNLNAPSGLRVSLRPISGSWSVPTLARTRARRDELTFMLRIEFAEGGKKTLGDGLLSCVILSRHGREISRPKGRYAHALFGPQRAHGRGVDAQGLAPSHP